MSISSFLSPISPFMLLKEKLLASNLYRLGGCLATSGPLSAEPVRDSKPVSVESVRVH
ncbi:hypothetical protein HanIR_Chr05g0211561 [Helianthus annuus]|nr:hypothetical protein HanIR_Chr05g0211561 [Helianthus annuus]